MSRTPSSPLQNVEDNEHSFGVPIFVLPKNEKNELSSQNIQVLVVSNREKGKLSLRDLSVVSKRECCRWQRMKKSSVRLVRSSDGENEKIMLFIVKRGKDSIRVSGDLNEGDVRVKPKDLESCFPGTRVFFGFQSVTAAINKQLSKKSRREFEHTKIAGDDKWHNIPGSFFVGTSREVRLSGYLLPTFEHLEESGKLEKSLAEPPKPGSVDEKTVATAKFDNVLERIVDCNYASISKFEELSGIGKLGKLGDDDMKVRVRFLIRKLNSSTSVYSSSSSSSSPTSSSSKIEDEDTKRVVVPTLKRSISSVSSTSSSSKMMMHHQTSQSCVEDWHIRSFFGGL